MSEPLAPAYYRVVYLDGLVTVSVAGARWLEQVQSVDAAEAQFTLQPLDVHKVLIGEPVPSSLRSPVRL